MAAALSASTAPSAILSLEPKIALMFGLPARIVSVTARPLARSHSAVCSATTLRPQPSSPDLAPSARACPVDWLIRPWRIATSEPDSTLSQIYFAARAAPAWLSVPMKLTPSLTPRVSTNTTGIPAALAASTTGASAFGSVGASAMPATPWAMRSSIWLIWAWTSDSAGGATTTTSTPSSSPLALAPASTAAQNGLPAPGPFMPST